MDSKQKILNKFLVDVYNDIMKIEERVLITEAYQDLTVNDMHVIDAIGYKDVQNMTAVANDLDVTVGTLTSSINGLVKKLYVKRIRSITDRRVVLISLTEKGKKAFKHHERFHTKMVKAVAADLDEEHYDALVGAMERLAVFFEEQYLVIRKRKKTK